MNPMSVAANTAAGKRAAKGVATKEVKHRTGLPSDSSLSRRLAMDLLADLRPKPVAMPAAPSVDPFPGLRRIIDGQSAATAARVRAQESKLGREQAEGFSTPFSKSIKPVKESDQGLAASALWVMSASRSPRGLLEGPDKRNVNPADVAEVNTLLQTEQGKRILRRRVTEFRSQRVQAGTDLREAPLRAREEEAARQEAFQSHPLGRFAGGYRKFFADVSQTTGPYTEAAGRVLLKPIIDPIEGVGRLIGKGQEARGLTREGLRDLTNFIPGAQLPANTADLLNPASNLQERAGSGAMIGLDLLDVVPALGDAASLLKGAKGAVRRPASKAAAKSAASGQATISAAAMDAIRAKTSGGPGLGAGPGLMAKAQRAVEPTEVLDRVPPHMLKVNPNIQYKSGVDPVTKATKKFAGIRDYNVDQGGTLTVWERLSGDLEIAHGHHRGDLANRAERFVVDGPDGELIEVPKELPIRRLKEADGWTEDRIRQLAAVENLRNGDGSAFDAAMVLRELGKSRDDLAGMGVTVRGALGRNVDGLMGLSDESLALVRSGQVREEVAAGIGAVADLPREMQAAAVRRAAGRGLNSYEDAKSFGSVYRDTTVAEASQGDLFGGEAGPVIVDTIDEQFDLRRAVSASMMGRYEQLKKGLALEELPGEVIQRDLRQAEVDKLGSRSSLKWLLDTAFSNDQTIFDAQRRLAKQVKDGETTVGQGAKELEGVVQEVLERRNWQDIVRDGDAKLRNVAERLRDGLPAEPVGDVGRGVPGDVQLSRSGGETAGGGEGLVRVAGDEVGRSDQARPIERVAVAGRDDFRRGLREVYDLSDEESDAVTALAEARAKGWAADNGRSPDDWFSESVSAFRRGKPQDFGQTFQDNRGAVQFDRDGRALILAMTEPNVSTAVHELGHIFRRQVSRADDAVLRAELGLAEKGSWTVEAEEAFARGFERYLRDGKTANTGLAAVFEKFKDWLKTVYATLKGSPVERRVSPEMKAVFERLLDEQGYGNQSMRLRAPKPAKDGDLAAVKTVTLDGENYRLNAAEAREWDALMDRHDMESRLLRKRMQLEDDSFMADLMRRELLDSRADLAKAQRAIVDQSERLAADVDRAILDDPRAPGYRDVGEVEEPEVAPVRFEPKEMEARDSVDGPKPEVWQMTKAEYDRLATQKDKAQFKEISVDWGQSGGRRIGNGQVMGAMSDAPRGVKKYKDYLSPLGLSDKEVDELKPLGASPEVIDAYIALRSNNFEHDAAMDAALVGHRALVEKAIREGRSVSPEVLADYPDLSVKPDLLYQGLFDEDKFEGGFAGASVSGQFSKMRKLEELGPKAAAEIRAGLADELRGLGGDGAALVRSYEARGISGADIRREIVNLGGSFGERASKRAKADQVLELGMDDPGGQKTLFQRADDGEPEAAVQKALGGESARSAGTPAAAKDPVWSEVFAEVELTGSQKRRKAQQFGKKLLQYFSGPLDALRLAGNPGTRARRAGEEIAAQTEKVLSLTAAYSTRLTEELMEDVRKVVKVGLLNPKTDELDAVAKAILDGTTDKLNPAQKVVWQKWSKLNRSLIGKAEGVGVLVDDVVRPGNWEHLYDQPIRWYGDNPKTGRAEELRGRVVGGGDDGLYVQTDAGGVVTLAPWRAFSRRSLVAPEKFWPLELKKEFRDAATKGEGDPDYERLLAAVQKYGVVGENGEGLEKALQMGESIGRRDAMDMLKIYFGDATQKEVAGGLARMERPRTPFRLPSEFYETDFIGQSGRHIQKSIQRLMEAEMWGQDMLGLKMLLDELPDNMEGNAQLVRQALGVKDKTPGADAARKVASIEGAWQSLSKLTAFGSAIVQVNQLASGIGVLGFRANLRAFGKVVKSLRGMTDDLARVRRSGAVDSWMMQLMQFEDYSQMAAKLTDWGLTVTGLKPIDTALRYQAALAGEIAATDAVRRLKVIDMDAKTVRFKDTPEHRLLKDWFLYPEKDIEQMFRTGQLNAQQRIMAYHGGVKTQVRTRPADVPSWFRDSATMRILFRFQSFQYGQMRILGHVAKEAQKGNVKPLLQTVAASAALGYLTKEAKNHLTAWMSDKEPKPMPEELSDKLLVSLAHSGFLALFSAPAEWIVESAVKEGADADDVLSQVSRKAESRFVPVLVSDVVGGVEGVIKARKEQNPATFFDQWLRQSVVLYGRLRKRSEPDTAALTKARKTLKAELIEQGYTSSEAQRMVDEQKPTPAPTGATPEYRRWHEARTRMRREGYTDSEIEDDLGDAPQKFAGVKE